MSATASGYDPGCRSCRQGRGEETPAHGVVYQDHLWLVRHSPPPYGLAGWMVVQPIRHVPSPGHFNDEEANRFGPFLRHCERTLQNVTGALKMYTATMGESVPHVHIHLVPRYAIMPADLVGWRTFEVHSKAAAGEIHIDAGEVQRIVAAYRAALVEEPPP